MSTEEPDGRRRRGLVRRELLLDATRRVIASSGVAGVSHRAVAAEAGVPKSAATYHFATLDELLTAALRSETEHLVEAMPDDVEGDLGWLAGELVAVYGEHRERMIAGFELYLLAARTPALRDGVQPWLRVLRAFAEHHDDDPVAVEAAVAAIDGYFLQRLATAREPDATELEAILRRVLG